MKKVLLVDDEPSIVTLLAFNLEKDGYEVTTATDGAVEDTVWLSQILLTSSFWI